MRTPLGRVLGFGSAHEGTGHFWLQRLTAVANVPLVIAFVVLMAALPGRPASEVVAILSSPLVALLLLFLMVSITVHMRIGVQVVIEDYIQASRLKTVLIMANTLFTVAVGGIAVFAILKLAFGGAP